jgi:Protein of unknown function (DUF2917)
VKTPQPMRDHQQLAGALWSVGVGQVRTLRIGPGMRVLRVAEGPLWLTVSGTPDDPPQDLWLQQGDAVMLESGVEIVVEGWPAARFQLIVPPQACSHASSAISAWLSRQRHAWQATLRRFSPAFAP